MSIDPGFLGWALYRSPITERVYVLNNGFVVGEVPTEAMEELPREQIQGDLHATAEFDYVRRKMENLRRYARDLDALQAHFSGSVAAPRPPEVRIADLLQFDWQKIPAPFRPRVAQLANSGCYAYAHGGWRYVLNPRPQELDALRRIPNPQLVAEAGFPAFLKKEMEQVRLELELARGLLERLHRHPDNDDVNRSYG